jgi:type VI secretion system FHA domain protein
MEARAEARFNCAMKSGRTGWAMKTARFYELVSGKIATFGLSAPSPPGGDLLEAFLRGAALENVTLPDPMQTMEQLGAAFRAMVSGIRQTLIARSEVKREFRIEATVIRSRGNNLLKFSANDDDALAGLLGAGRHTDMVAGEAVADALRDIRLHELATMTALQTAVRALVVRLGPDQVRDAKDQGGGLGLLSNRKAKAWDAYTALHAEILRGLSDDFDSLFGKRFALAYEQAMQELMATRSDDRR